MSFPYRMTTAAGAVGLVVAGLAMIQPVASASAQGAPTPIFSIGTPDGSDAEFALAPTAYQTINSAFPNGVDYTVGTSTPGQDWPYIQPGPADGWGGSELHPYQINYTLPSVPTTAPELVISYFDTQNSIPPAVTIVSNGTTVKTLATPAGGPSGFDSETPSPSTLALDIPTSTLKAGSNTLTITNTSGSWSVYDAVQLEPSQVVAPTPIVTALPYNAPAGSDGGLDNPMGVTTNGNGTVYVSNSADNVVSSIDGNTTTLIAGSYENYGESGDGGPATSATLDQPSGLATDAAGDLFIADTEDNVVREVAPDGTITDVAGNGTAGYAGDSGPAIDAELDGPTAVAVDGQGDLFVADADNNVIREVKLATGVISTFAGTGTTGYSGDGGQATDAQLNTPSGVAVDSEGNVYIADSGNNVIRRVGTDGTISTVAGDYAADQANDGLGGYSGDGGPAVDAQLHAPEGVFVDRAGNLFIADTFNNSIREVTPGDVISTVVKGLVNGPYALTVDNSTGNLYVTDTSGNAVRELSGLPVPGAAGPGPVASTSGPNPQTPEAPLAVALPLVAVGLAGGAVVIRRRRNRPVTD